MEQIKYMQIFHVIQICEYVNEWGHESCHAWAWFKSNIQLFQFVDRTRSVMVLGFRPLYRSFIWIAFVQWAPSVRYFGVGRVSRHILRDTHGWVMWGVMMSHYRCNDVRWTSKGMCITWAMSCLRISHVCTKTQIFQVALCTRSFRVTGCRPLYRSFVWFVPFAPSVGYFGFGTDGFELGRDVSAYSCFFGFFWFALAKTKSGIGQYKWDRDSTEQNWQRCLCLVVF